jgi:hypothetical protein
MPIRYSAVLADALARFRRDGDLLIRMAAPFLFLPALALELLVPPPPARSAGSAGDEAALLAWADAFGVWLSANGGWYAIAYVVQTLGAGAILSLYLHQPQPDARGALARSVALLPRLLLAALLVALPAGAGLLLWIVPGLYVLGRTMAAAPILMAEAPIGAGAAVIRAIGLSRGAGLSLAAATGTVLLAGYVLALPFAMLGAGAAGSSVMGAIAGLGGAAVTASAALANVLLAISAYRMLSARQGI